MGIQAVVFDIGNVLIEWNPERFYDAEIGRERREELFAQVDLHAMNDRVDMGEDFRTTIYDAAERHPAYRDAIRLWHDRWIDMASPAIDQSVQLLRALRSNGVPVFALSNFGIGTFAQAQSVYDFLHEFDRPYISGHLGVIKPDPEIYRILEDDSGLPPESLLFADDRADNIAMAASRGWQTHLFDGPQGWADRLVAEGLLAQEQAA
ncbi:HAD family hydrolase [Pseudooceanicola onchidii]|uniref:HAD family hydrolase n=1 Tax=Pseudooceanicola onchidii TaxID=2562279 RepID=UPI0010AB0D7F|nr:HAD family phosphatase [Pseudooceanicola onchidii]